MGVVIKGDQVEKPHDLDVTEIDVFSVDDMMKYTGAWAEHLGIEMLKHLQRIGKCQVASEERCVQCYAEAGNHCYMKNSKSLTRACAIELAEYMRREHEANVAANKLKASESK
jgi:hypothetical protein